MTENSSSKLERTSQNSISFPYTRSNEFNGSKSGVLNSRIRFKPVRSDVLMRELLKEENSPKAENNTKNISISSNNIHTESKQDSICNEDDSSTSILDRTLIEDDSVVTETNDLMPGFAWLDKTPNNKPIKSETIEESPSQMFSKLSIRDNKSEKKQNDHIYHGLSEYLFKTPSFKNYKTCTPMSKIQCSVPKMQYNNDSIISSSNPQLLSAKKNDVLTPKREAPQLNKNDTPKQIVSACFQLTPRNNIHNQVILREKNMNIVVPQGQPILKKELKTEQQEQKKIIVPPKNVEKKVERPRSNMPEYPKRSVVQNKQIVPHSHPHPPPSTPVKSLAESTFQTLKIKGKDYIMINKLGEGGSGQVYLCLEHDTLKDRAVKVVNLAVDAHTAASYVNEVKMLEDLQGNDRVIRMYDFEQQNQNLFVVMEKGDVDFSVFLRSITSEPQIQRHTIIYYWVEMLKCVKEIHKNGIIHSDLKPSNFLLVGGRLKLIDFGIASKITGDMTSVIKNEQVGTFNYISPEALLDSRENPTEGKPRIRISYKSDVWSLGCILYQMVYRKTPFHNFTSWMTKVVTIIDRNHRIDYPTIEGIPPQLIDMIKKCLLYDMKNRPSVEELLHMYYTGNY